MGYFIRVAKDPKKGSLDPMMARELIVKLERRTFLEEIARLTQGLSTAAGNPGRHH